MTNNPLVETATSILLRAVQLEQENKLTECLVCYQEGIGIYIKALRLLSDAADRELKARLKEKVNDYMAKAERLKTMLKTETAKGKYHEQLTIAEGSFGYGYQRIFGRFLGEGNVREVWIEDPYIRSSFQIENFSHFCEVLVRSESPVSKIHLLTTKDPPKPEVQLEKFHLILEDLQKHQIKFEWKFSETLHDREIRFDNGWIVKIGRGLDYVRGSLHKFCGLGVHDFDFRPCSATTVDIFHRSALRM